MTIQVKITKQLFITLAKVSLTFEFVDEILKCDYLIERYRSALFIVLSKELLTSNSLFKVMKCKVWVFSLSLYCFRVC